MCYMSMIIHSPFHCLLPRADRNGNTFSKLFCPLADTAVTHPHGRWASTSLFQSPCFAPIQNSRGYLCLEVGLMGLDDGGMCLSCPVFVVLPVHVVVKSSMGCLSAPIVSTRPGGFWHRCPTEMCEVCCKVSVPALEIQI
jgi:hypothetical protein